MDNESRRCIYAWIDANVPYYSTWDMTRPHSKGGRDLMEIPDAENGHVPAPWVEQLEELCKKWGIKPGQITKDLNFTHPKWSPGVQVLLAKWNGGTREAELLNLLEEIRQTTLQYPRIDMEWAVAIPQQRDFGRTY